MVAADPDPDLERLLKAERLAFERYDRLRDYPGDVQEVALAFMDGSNGSSPRLSLKASLRRLGQLKYRWAGNVQIGTATLSCSRYIFLMAGVTLNKSELKALASVDGTRAQAEMSPEIKLRLYDLGLIERREWPNGSLWRTDLGDRHVRRGPVLFS
jgi:hypothetical protein